MTKDQLIQELTRLKINPVFYSLDGELKENAVILKKIKDNKIAVFFLERGEAVNPKIFKEYDKAHDEILKLFQKELKHNSGITIE